MKETNAKFLNHVGDLLAQLGVVHIKSHKIFFAPKFTGSKSFSLHTPNSQG